MIDLANNHERQFMNRGEVETFVKISGAGRAVALANVCAEIELAALKTKAHERMCEATLRNVFISQRVTESLALAKLSIQNHKGLLKVYLGIRFPSARDR